MSLKLVSSRSVSSRNPPPAPDPAPVVRTVAVCVRWERAWVGVPGTRIFSLWLVSMCRARVPGASCRQGEMSTSRSPWSAR